MPHISSRKLIVRQGRRLLLASAPRGLLVQLDESKEMYNAWFKLMNKHRQRLQKLQQKCFEFKKRSGNRSVCSKKPDRWKKRNIKNNRQEYKLFTMPSSSTNTTLLRHIDAMKITTGSFMRETGKSFEKLCLIWSHIYLSLVFLVQRNIHANSNTTKSFIILHFHIQF